MPYLNPPIITAPVGGVISCDYLRGIVRKLGQRVRLSETPGQDGYSGQLEGRGKARFELRAIKRDTPANIETWEELMRALEGQMVSIRDDWGREINRLIVADVDEVDRVPYGPPLGGASNVRLELKLTGVQQVEVTA